MRHEFFKQPREPRSNRRNRGSTQVFVYTSDSPRLKYIRQMIFRKVFSEFLPSVTPIYLHLVSIPEPFQSLNHLAAGSSSLIRAPKLQGEQAGNNESQAVRDETSNNAGSVGWGVCLPEDRRADDTANSTAANKSCGGEGSFPLLSS